MRRGSTVRVALAALLAAVSIVACGGAPGPTRTAGETGPPWCDDWSVLVLSAQSAPTAQLLPCIEAVPIGWSADGANIDDQGTVFTLDSKIAGDDAARIELGEECDTTGYVQVPSDIVGADRFEFIESIRSGVRGERVYVFDGGCVAVEVDLRVDVSAALINEISLALGFVTRDEVNDVIRDVTDGREQVDP